MIDLRHPLAELATRMPWDQIEASVAPCLKRKRRTVHFSPLTDLFETTTQVAGVGVSPAGRLRLPIRLMVSLLNLQHAYGLSDDEGVQRWAQDVLRQLFQRSAVL